MKRKIKKILSFYPVLYFTKLNLWKFYWSTWSWLFAYSYSQLSTASPLARSRTAASSSPTARPSSAVPSSTTVCRSSSASDLSYANVWMMANGRERSPAVSSSPTRRQRTGRYRLVLASAAASCCSCWCCLESYIWGCKYRSILVQCSRFVGEWDCR